MHAHAIYAALYLFVLLASVGHLSAESTNVCRTLPRFLLLLVAAGAVCFWSSF
jgi:hypothetical protein